MTFTRAQAKQFCTDAELELFDLAQPKKIKELTIVELKDLVSRSRTMRNKWRDVSRRQRRSSQSAKKQRQTVDNARSHDKEQLFSDVHDAFVARLADAEAGRAEVDQGKRARVVPRTERRVIASEDRTALRKKLRNKKAKVNTANKKAEKKSLKKTVSSTSRSEEPAKDATPTSSASTTRKKSVKKVTAKKMAAKDSSKSLTRGKKPTVSKARKAKLAKQDAIAEANQISTSRRNVGPDGKIMPDVEPTKSRRDALNRKQHRLATKKIVASGGGRRQKAHVASATKRSQARRDSK